MATPTALPATAHPTTVQVVIVRHGERLDEVPDAAVLNDRPNWDPPLTRNGMKQGAQAGLRLRSMLPFDRMYVSPCTRTLQTASHAAAQLGHAIVLRPVPGLAECAAAVHDHGLPNFNPGGAFKARKPKRFLTHEDAPRYCAEGTRFEPTDPHFDESFEDCVARLCTEAAAEGLRRIVIVSHREGIRDLCNLAGERGRARTAYCCVACFGFTVGEAARPWALLVPPTTDALPPLPLGGGDEGQASTSEALTAALAPEATSQHVEPGAASGEAVEAGTLAHSVRSVLQCS